MWKWCMMGKMDDIKDSLKRIEAKVDGLVTQGATDKQLAALTKQLQQSQAALQAAIANNQSPVFSPLTPKGTTAMPNPALANLQAQVASTVGIEQSAVLLITGFAQRVQDAITAAIAGGATAAELAPVQAEVDALNASATALAAAVASNPGP